MKKRNELSNLKEMEKELGDGFLKKSIYLIGSKPDRENIIESRTQWMLEQCRQLTLGKKHVLFIVQESKLPYYLDAMKGQMDMEYIHFREEMDLTPRKLENMIHRLYRKINKDPEFIFIENLNLVMWEDEEEKVEEWTNNETLNKIMLGLETVFCRIESTFMIGFGFSRRVKEKNEINDFNEEFKRYGMLNGWSRAKYVFGENKKIIRVD